MKTIIIGLIFLYVYCLADAPVDWQPRIAAAQMLYSPTDTTVDPSLRASIGNGYVGTVISTDTMYVAGLFNGAATTDPSHRARIPATAAISISGSTTYATALDLERGTYYRRSTLGSTNIEQRWYAHRATPNLLIHEMQVNLSDTMAVTLNLVNNHGAASSDLTLKTVSASGDSVIQVTGPINTPELPNGEIVTLAYVYDDIPSSVNIKSSTTLYFITALRTSIESTQPLDDANNDYQTARKDPSSLWGSHVDAWAQIWQSGFEIEGRMDVATTVNSSLYYILSSVREDRVFSLSPGSLSSNGYNGHTFWDCETWMYPSLLLLQPSIAKSLLQYRSERLDEAIQKALSYSPPFAGAMIPWESAFTGAETCPTWAGTGLREQHISGDVAFAVRQYWQATHDTKWLAGIFPLIEQLADFWVSKAQSASDGMLHVNDIIPPDEYADHVNDSIYTNYVAMVGLNFANQSASIVGQSADPNWVATANKLPLLFDQTLQIHPEYAGYNGQTIKQADVVLLGYPLQMSMDPVIRGNDLDYYAARTDSGGPAMTWGMHAIGYLDLGQADQAASNFNRSFANAQQPYLVWTETPTGGTTNFITGAGGFLQGVTFGYPGLRLKETGLELNPKMIEGARSIRTRGVWYLGNRLDIFYTQQTVTVVLTNATSSASSLFINSTSLVLNQSQVFNLPLTNPPLLIHS